MKFPHFDLGTYFLSISALQVFPNFDFQRVNSEMDSLDLCHCILPNNVEKPKYQQNSVPKYLSEIICTWAFKTFTKKSSHDQQKEKNLSQCEKWRNFLSFRSYVKLIFPISDSQKITLLTKGVCSCSGFRFWWISEAKSYRN